MKKTFKFLFVTSGALISIFAGIVFAAAMIEAIREGFANDGNKIRFGFLLWSIVVVALGGLFGAWMGFKENKYNLSLVIGSIYLLINIIILGTHAQIVGEGWLSSMHIFLVIFSTAFLVLGVLLIWLNMRDMRNMIYSKTKVSGKRN